MNETNILVVGETCTDKFIYGDCKRLNPEAPTPVFVPTEEITNLGMAGNTVENLKWLGLTPQVISVHDDIVKTRYVENTSNYILLRVDDEPEIEPLTHDIIYNIDFNTLDIIVISDYDKGLISEDFLEYLFTMAKGHGVPTFMDTKKVIGSWAEDCDYIKINEKEYNNPEHYDYLSGAFGNKVIVTLGHNGATHKNVNYPVGRVDARDVVGAGDTFLAGLVYGYLLDNQIADAIRLANILASNVVTKKGVALPDEKLFKL